MPGREAAAKENITFLIHHQPFAIFPSILQVTGEDSACIMSNLLNGFTKQGQIFRGIKIFY